MKGILHILYFICLVWMLAACSTTKYVGDGEYLLDKVEIVSDNVGSASSFAGSGSRLLFWILHWWSNRRMS